jgi:hypothetical protein
MAIDLDGAVALVTGGANGIGAARRQVPHLLAAVHSMPQAR